MLPWSQCQHRPLISIWPWRQQGGPQTPTCSLVSVQTPGIHTALFGNRSQGYQFRALLLLGHRLRHGPRQQPLSGRHHSPMWQQHGPQIATCHRMQPRRMTSQALEPDCFRITDSGCGRTLDTDIFTGHLGSYVTMTPSRSTGLSDWHGPRWWPRPQHWHSFDIISSYDINTDLGQDSTVAPGLHTSRSDWCCLSGSNGPPVAAGPQVMA